MDLNDLAKSLVSAVDKLNAIHDSVQKCHSSLGSLWHELRAIRVSRNLELFRLLDPERYADPKRLLQFQRQISSQNGEDGMIHEIFRRIGTTNRVFAEVGVGDGTENNTAFLFSQGWTGFWVDGNSNFMEKVRRLDPSSQCLKSKQALADRENIGAIFRELGVPQEFDLLSLDIDQNTYYLWEGLADYRPRVVVVEYNGALPSDVDWKVNYDPKRCWNGSQNFGASLKAYDNLAKERGYSLVGCDFTGINAFFVCDEALGDHFREPFTPENHLEPPRYSLTYRWSHNNEVLDRMT